MTNNFYSKKFALAVLSLLSLDALLWFDKIDDSLFVTALIATVGAYIAANVIQKATAKAPT